MQEFLDQLVFGNSVRMWLVAAVIIVVAAITKRFVSKYVAIGVHKLVKKRLNTKEQAVFVSQVIRPLGFLILGIISYITLDRLSFPAELKFKMLGHSTEQILPAAGQTFIIVCFFWFLINLVSFISMVLKGDDSIQHSKNQYSIILFFRDLIKAVLVITCILVILQFVFNRDVRVLLQGLTIIGAAVALAAKESLENLIASFIIFIDKPFQAGDFVKLGNNTTGTVERIGLRSTKLRTLEKTMVTIPNKQMVDGIVDNLSNRTSRRAEARIEFSTKVNAVQANHFVDEMKKLLASKQEDIMSYSVFVTDFSKNGSTVIAEYYTRPFSMNELNELKQVVNLGIMKMVDDQNLELSGASNVINVFTNENDAAVPPSPAIV